MRILITAGPTREFIDPVRFISNRSTGKMGYAIAEAAIAAGHEVILVSGPVSLEPPAGLFKFVSIVSALDLLEAVQRELPDTEALVMTAAVADFRPKQQAHQKLHKKATDGRDAMPTCLELTPNPDILKTIRPLKENRIFVGFAAETNDVISSATDKLVQKGLDLLVANDVTKPGAGFGTDTNLVTLLEPNQAPVSLPLQSKRSIGDEIVRFLERKHPIV